MIVLLGEVGGVEEYELCEALKTGKVWRVFEARPVEMKNFHRLFLMTHLEAIPYRHKETTELLIF